MTDYNLTEKEKELLRASFGDDRIGDEILYDQHITALKQLRAVESYLNEKYTDISFSLLSFSPATRLTEKGECRFQWEGDTVYRATVKPDNGSYACADDFYGVLLRERYDAAVRSLLQESNIDCIPYTEFPVPYGMELNGNISVDTLNALTPKVTRNTRLYVPAYEKVEGIEATLQALLTESGFYGSYTVFFVPDYEGADLAALEAGRREYERLSFNCFDVA